MSIFLLVWSFPGFRNPTYQQERYYNAQDHETGEDNPVIRPSLWETYTTPSDTYAQWIMACLSVVATGFSVWAVLLVRQTLDESRKSTDAAVSASKAATRSNELARAEHRPWLTIRRKYKSLFSVLKMGADDRRFDYEVRMIWRCKIVNLGKTPAFGIKTRNRIICSSSYSNAASQFRAFANSIDAEGDARSENTIFPGDKDYVVAFESYAKVTCDGDRRPRFYLMSALSYRTPESDIIGFEARLIGIEFDDDTFGPWCAELVEYVAARITR
ncbi:MAG: hypothetical protein K8H74_11970 [Notoacmeibacter sp.]|nr:hypothetical protein [Notoacmeibacter sp.]